MWHVPVATIRGRLLWLMTLVMVPVALMGGGLAYFNYSSALQAEEDAQVELARNYGMRARNFFHAASRATVAATMSVRAAQSTEVDCAAVARGLSSTFSGLLAARFDWPGVSNCQYTRLPDLDDERFRAMMMEQRSKPLLDTIPGSTIGAPRYDVVTIGEQTLFAVYVRLSKPHDPLADFLLLINPATFEVGPDDMLDDGGSIVAVLRPGGQVVVSKGIEASDRSWLPALEQVPQSLVRFTASSTAGITSTYGADTISPDLYLITRFADDTTQAAFRQALVLGLLPTLLLVLLFVAYTTSIDRDVVRWVRAIETSARRRGADGYDRVAVTDDMPQDLQRVALAYNSLVDDAEARQNQLQAALATNGGLLRELNHHIKNSLQVLQSYLAISRRFSSRDPDPALLEIEAKVLVLSSVYRRALREGSMQPVELAAFIEELVAWLNRNLAGSGHNIFACMKEVAFPLNVDRTIPLGLAIVEAVAAAVRLPDMTRTDVCIASIDSDSVDIKVTCNGDHAALDLPARILSGLARQLQADDVRQTTDAILHWRFRVG